MVGETAHAQVNCLCDAERTRGQPWIYFSYGMPEVGPASKLDDSVAISLEVLTDRLVRERDEVGKDVLRSDLFALNWATAAADDATTTAILEEAYKYNFWS